MIKKLSLVLMLMSASGLQADESSFKMGVVDFQQALNSVEEGKTAKANIEKELEKRRKLIEDRKKEMAKLEKELSEFQQQASSIQLSPKKMEEGRNLQQNFLEKRDEYLQFVQKTEAEMRQKEMEATQKILNRLRDMVVNFGRKDGYRLVLEKNESGLIYASNYTDLTEKLIQEYNKKYKGS